MKHRIITLALMLTGLMVSGQSVSPQSCDEFIDEVTNLDGIPHVRTIVLTVVSRFNYEYSIEFLSDDKGIYGGMRSKGGVALNQGDELILADSGNVRMAFQFFEFEQTVIEGDTPLSRNFFQMDKAAMEWLANSYISVIWLKDNIKKEIRKFKLDEDRKLYLNKMAACFEELLVP